MREIDKNIPDYSIITSKERYEYYFEQGLRAWLYRLADWMEGSPHLENIKKSLLESENGFKRFGEISYDIKQWRQ